MLLKVSVNNNILFSEKGKRELKFSLSPVESISPLEALQGIVRRDRKQRKSEVIFFTE